MWSRAAFASVLGLFVVFAAATSAVRAEETGDPAAEIAELLDWFLAPENNSRAATHQRFWADELVYTRSSGEVLTKSQILSGFDSAESRTDDMRWSAEDVLVRPYRDAAALTFRLVGRAADGSVTRYRNSAMFLKRGGQWQAVTWQATRMPDSTAP